MSQGAPVLIIACGALAHEITQLRKANNWTHVDVQCLRADFHNTPDKITPGVQEQIEKARGKYQKIFVAYADCGTGGHLDALLEKEGVERLPGAHCYEFFAGSRVFEELMEAELGTFYLTDYLAQHFERIILKGFGIDKHPELESMMFGNYCKLVYLSQTENAGLLEKAQQAAQRLGLEFEHRVTGYGELETGLKAFVSENQIWQN